MSEVHSVIKNDSVICHHIGIFVDDMERIIQFYCQHLGFRFEREFSCDEQMMKTLFRISTPSVVKYLRRGDFRLELFHFQNAKLIARKDTLRGYNHWTLLVENKEGFCQDLKKKGIKIIEAAKKDGHVYLIEDPEGNLVEIKEKQKS